MLGARLEREHFLEITTSVVILGEILGVSGPRTPEKSLTVKLSGNRHTMIAIASPIVRTFDHLFIEWLTEWFPVKPSDHKEGISI